MSKTLLQQIEQAWESDILVEFIANYIGSGSGTLSEIEACVKDSELVSQTDIDNTMKMIDMKKLLPEKKDPYKQFVQIYNDAIDYDDLEVKNMLAAVYFPHMGNSAWDNAYEKILSNFESLKAQRTERQIKYDQTKKEEVDRIMNEALDRDIMTVQDLLANEIDNVSDDGIDSDIQLFKFIARELGVKDYDKMFVAVDDGNYNPEWLLEDSLMIPYKSKKLYYYASQNMVAELHDNGNIFMYFATQESADKYFDLAKKFLDDFEIDENPFNEATEPEVKEHKRWRIVNLDDDTNDSAEEVTVDSLQEALHKRDKATNNAHDLLNLYLSERFNQQAKETLVRLLNEGVSDVKIKEFLSPNTSILVEEVEDATDIISELETKTSTNGSIEIATEDDLDKAVDWLQTNGIDYDTETTADGTYTLTWYVGADETSTDDVNVKTATEMKEALTSVIGMLDEIINSDMPFKAAMFNDGYIRETLTEVLASCDKFDY